MRVRWKGERLVGCETRLVAFNEQHLSDVAVSVTVALVEGETARHAHQLVDGDGPSRVALIAPFGHQRRIGERKLAVLHAKTDQRIHGALADRPTDQRHGGIEARSVAFGDDAAALHYDKRPGAARMGWVGFGEDVIDSLLKRRAVNPFGQG